MTSTSIRRPRTTGVRVLGLLGALALGLTAACSSADPQQPPAPVTEGPTIDADKQPVPTPSVAPTWPLTGVPVEGEPVNRPAIGVKVENTSAARPQTGLEEADVVWETIVEFQVSRFVAVYHSQVPDSVGPIRSVRPVDPTILAPLDAMLAFSGGQPGIVQVAKDAGLQLLSNDAGVKGMSRSSARPAPHNVYGDMETLWSLADADHQDSPQEQFGFARSADQATAVVSGSPATTLAFRLSAASSPSWTWDAGSGTWLRAEGSAPAVAASGERLSAVNVVSIVAEHPDTKFKAQGGTLVPTYKLKTEGEGTLATGGKTFPVVWKKADPQDAMRLYLPDGTEALLAPGNTWVELVPKGSGSLTIS